MELFRTSASVAILFCSAMTLLMGIEQLTGRVERARYNVVFFFISILSAIILFNHVLFGNAVTPSYPWSAFFYLTALYAIGPITYLYYLLLILPVRRIRLRRIWHLVPAFIILCLDIYLQTKPYTLKQQVLDAIFHSTGFHFLLLIQYIGGAIFVTYQIILLVVAISLLNKKSIRNGLRLIIFLELINVASVVPGIFWMIYRHNELMLVSGLMTSTVMITVFLTNNRFPRILNLMKRELIRRRYKRSFLMGLDIDTIRVKLFSLMEKEHAYRDGDMTLRTLSQKMSLTPHQLSQFLNEQLKTSFATFINKYRVNEAKKLLSENADQNILTICYVVGFNSKSSFNTVFKKLTGRTPTVFRSQLKNKE
ncbi:MAG: hypothetical protein A2176_12740 [Spirochaetes bacterium RBG_13_51_14]|nr:MAG: hypothetical protein A2176_12740 [Spirochaetes bacterium RBG_13_51_14]